MIRDRSLGELEISVSVGVLTFVALQILRLKLLCWWRREVSSS